MGTKAERAAKENEPEKKVETYPSTITAFGNASVIENVLIYDGKRVSMYPTFKDKEAAIQDLYRQAGNLLADISYEYGLETLSEENWQEFYDKSQSYIFDESNGLNEADPEALAILRYFDIRENDECNQEIIDNYGLGLEEAGLYSLPYDREHMGFTETE